MNNQDPSTPRLRKTLSGVCKIRRVRGLPSVVGAWEFASTSGKGCVHRGVRSPSPPEVLPPVLRDYALSESDSRPRDQERGSLRH